MSAGILGRVQRRAAKLRRSAVSAAVTPQLAARSARSDRSLVDASNPVVVSLTSYGQRLDTVHLTIESIGRGNNRPARLILWTDPGVVASALSPMLRRQMTRGLEVVPSPARYGPHTKYFPYVSSVEHHSWPLVTADDDSIYPRWWLRRLQNSATRNPDDVVCYRAHRVAIDSDGVIAPYNTWDAARGSAASLLNFATGVSGVHYPAEFLMRLKKDGDGFLACAPRADDVWLHSRAVAHGFGIRQIVRSPIKFPEIASTQEVALHLSNTGRSANDTQIAATYDEAARTALRAVAAR